MKINIGGRSWTILLKQNLPDGVMGQATIESREIEIRSGLSDKNHASTVLHEMLHAISPSLDEKRVGRIERALFPLLWRDGWRPQTLWRLKP